MPILKTLAALPRRRASAATAMTLVAMITTVGSLPAQAADATPTAATRLAKSAEPSQTLTVGAQPASPVQVDTFTAADAVAEPVAAAPAEPAPAEPAPVAAEAEAAPAPAPEAAPAPAPVAAPAPAVQWPFGANTSFSDPYGPRTSPCSGCSTFHDGLDMTPGAGTPIGSIADGVVKSVTTYDDGGLGVHVMVDHVVDGQNVTSTYGHMTVGSITVSPGQSVTAGQQLGAVGSTGQSTGPHMHLEIHLNGVTAVDPFSWLTQHAGAM